jgi:hypothetical protein
MFRRRTCRALAAVLVFVAVVGVAGCTSSPVAKVTTAVPKSSGIQPPVTDPLWAYEESPAEMVAMQQAEGILTKRCMATFGFDYVIQHTAKFVGASSVLFDARLYGITDPVQAKLYGYLIDPTPPPPLSGAKLAGTDAYQLVFRGLRPGEAPVPGKEVSPGKVGGLVVPAGGCLGAARQELTGNADGHPTDDSLAAGLKAKAWSDGWYDPRTVAAKAEWAACLAKSGYTRTDPLMDKSKYTRELSTPPSPAEIAAALADIACKKSTNFVAKANKVNIEYSLKAVEENQLSLQASKAFWSAALVRANTLIAKG